MWLGIYLIMSVCTTADGEEKASDESREGSWAAQGHKEDSEHGLVKKGYLRGLLLLSNHRAREVVDS